MKKLKHLFYFSFFIFSFSFSFGQSWQWGQEAYGSLKTNDYGTPVATDKDGNVYNTGQFDNILIFGKGAGVIILICNTENAYLAKYDASGNVLWAIQPSDSGSSSSYSATVTTDKEGNVYIAGRFLGTVTFGSYTLRTRNSYGTFIAKYDASGNPLWARQGNSGNTYYYNYSGAYSVTTDKSGNALLTGNFEDSITFGTYTLISQNRSSMFLVKYDATGNVLWALQSNAPNTNLKDNFVQANSVTTDNMENVYVTGYFEDTAYFDTAKLYTTTNSGVFTVKYSSSGAFLWVRQSVNGSSNSLGGGFSVVTDQENNSYVAGYFQDIVSFDTYQLYSPATYSVFLIKYNPAGTLQWAKQSSAAWLGNCLACDQSDHIYLSGIMYFQNPDTLAFGDFKLATNPWVRYAGYVVEFNSEGKAICGTMLNGLGYFNDPVGVTCDPTGDYIYVGGTFALDTLLCGPDTLEAKGGGANVFTGRWKPCTAPDKYPTGGGESYQSCIFVPDAFSPGNDHNNILYVRGSCINSLDFSVFDRWGNRLFETQNINKGWDGTFKGQGVNMGTYIWYLNATLQNGSTVEQNGNITLIR